MLPWLLYRCDQYLSTLPGICCPCQMKVAVAVHLCSPVAVLGTAHLFAVMYRECCCGVLLWDLACMGAVWSCSINQDVLSMAQPGLVVVLESHWINSLAYPFLDSIVCVVVVVCEEDTGFVTAPFTGHSGSKGWQNPSAAHTRVDVALDFTVCPASVLWHQLIFGCFCAAGCNL